jgi:CRP-like cAMP-binding protein
VGKPKTDALKQVPLFTRCSKKELDFLAAQMDEAEVGEGQVLTRQGKPGHTFYLLLDGEVDVTVDRTRRGTLGPGEFFGEISMLDRGPATATTVTKSPVRLMVMSHMQFRDAIKANEGLLSRVMAAMAERLRQDSLARPARAR